MSSNTDVACQTVTRLSTDVAVQTFANPKTDESMTMEDERFEKALQENGILVQKVSELERNLVEATPGLCAAENYLLKCELKKLQEYIDKTKGFLFKSIEDKDIPVTFFTGLPNKETFFALLGLFDNVDIQYAKKWKVTRLDRQEQLFITIFKLRRGVSNYDLGTRFGVDKATISNFL